MANNKIQLSDGTVLLDLTDTTATASDVASGKYFHGADGVLTLGTASGGGGQAAGFLTAMLSNSADLQNYTEIPGSPTAIAGYGFYHLTNLRLTSLPDSVTSIGEWSFNGCYDLALTSLPANLTSIGEYAFWACYNALNISTIPSGVTRIETGAFGYTWPMTDLTIPSGVNYIGSMAFYECNGTTAYHLKPTTPPTLASTDAFSGISANCKIYVPAGCLSAYQTASNWSTYASHMEEE